MYRTEELITSVHAAGEEDVDAAVAAARRAFKGPWSQMSGTARAALLHKLADLAEERTDEFASIDTWNNGKRFSSARSDVGELTSLLRYYAGYADKIHGKGQCLRSPPCMPIDSQRLECGWTKS